MKKIIFALLCICITAVSVVAEANQEEAQDEIINKYITTYGDEINRGLEMTDTDSYLDFNTQELLKKATKGESLFSISQLFSKLSVLFVDEIKRTMKRLVIIPLIAILNTYLTGMHNSFNTKGATTAAFFTCYTIMAGIGASAFVDVVSCGHETIQNISVFMRILMPVTLASLASGGAVISATSFEVALISIIEISEVLVEKIFIPLAMAAASLNIVNNLSSFINAEKLVQLINKFVKWGIGLMLTVFVGVTGLQGVAAGSVDGLTVKITKFAASNIIPMVGGILAETVETVMNCSVVIKNAVGVVGIIAVIYIAIVPIVKMAVCLMLFRICAAVIQPISDEKSVKCISQLGDSVSAMLAMTVAIVVMFVIMLTIVINIGNIAILFGR